MFPQPDGKRIVVLVTDRNMSMAEVMRNNRSKEYDISAIVMDLQQGEDGREKGHLGTQPMRLPNITREK